MAVYQLYQSQKIPVSQKEIWDFISAPANLKKITPVKMGFQIVTEHLKDQIFPGQIISYKVKPILGIKTTWVTEITQVKEGLYFVDEQRVGPYKMWHHEHWIHPLKNGVLMEDLITYQPPFGILGRLMNHLIIKKKLEKIFAFRKTALIKIFGEYQEQMA